MNSYKTYICLTLLALSSCKNNDDNSPQTLTPQIRYEFSGGAGHYNYAPSIIQDEYGIRYENKARHSGRRVQLICKTN